MFPSISPKQSFPALESEILAYWKANDTFQKSVDSRPIDNPYRFYDGPPFITGMPHYGSLLSSIVKDAVGRYWTMQGRRVERTWGWDCHGLPIEEKVQKKLGLKSNKEIEENGVKKFIDECYSYTSEVSSEWNWYIDKIGRWVDMDNAYRTMDQNYMESVMWVFSELWKKGLIYEGKRVSLYSWKLGTPISNFEVAMDDTYQEVNDPAITVKFRPEIIRACGIIVENDKGEILLGHNKKGFWAFPGGKGESGETHAQCATRELFEETGIQYEISEADSVNFEQYDVIGGRIFDNRRYRINIGNTSVGNGEPEVFTEWKFFVPEDFPENMFEPSRYAYDLIKTGKIQKNLPLSILAWTTTPWTIPANMALAVRNDIDYVLLENNSEQYIVAKNRAEVVFKGKGDYTIIRELKGSDLVGLSYIPPFPEYYYARHAELDSASSIFSKDPETDPKGISNASRRGTSGGQSKNHRIYHADFITDTDGTGIGHEAPEFGDVDFQLAKKEGIYISEAMDGAGRYTSQIFDYEGTHYLDLENPEKGANRINIERMKANNTLFKLEGITHRVPFCPRSGTPLMQKAQASWFIDIQSQKDKLLEANEQINWFPAYLKHGRFAKGIETAPDWCISRTRYWGAPMPVWLSGDGEKTVVSSRDEIFEKNKVYGQLTKLIITRHAESEGNVEKKYDDTGYSPLSSKGQEQAMALVEELKDSGVDIIITSPFVRAIETARPLAEKLGIEIITMPELKETDHGTFANAHESPERAQERKNVLENKDHKFGETGESYNDIQKRMKTVIDMICEQYPGKTVMIVSHGIPVKIAIEYITGQKAPEKTKNCQTHTYILDTVYKKQLNLHKPYIDSILLQDPKGTKAKKVLGVHGYKRTDKVVDFFDGTKKNLEKEGITMDIPVFEISSEIDYTNWEKKFDEINISSYDTILTHSLGSRAIMNYIVEKGVSLQRLVMVAPSMRSTRPEVQSFYDSLSADLQEIKKYVSEIIVLTSDDDTGREGEAKKVAELIEGQYIEVSGFGHFNVTELPLIEGLVKYGTPMKRIPEVLDVWMDSGSMPYAQMHYPFENQEAMQASFPADFIAEYVGQIRAWFYVMHVLGVLLMSKEETSTYTNTMDKNNVSKTEDNSDVSVSSVSATPSFLNVITTGVVNGNDGRKMSKSFGNYPDPRMAIEKYGADPIRFYMLNSPLLSGGDMDFKEEGIMETIKGVMLPIWNTYSFFTTYANIDRWEPTTTEVWFTRHAESASNIAGKMSDGTDDPELTQKGREQAKNAGKTLRDQGRQFDVIIHTDLIRTSETARIIATEIGFTGEYIVDDAFIEQSMGEYAGKTLDEVAIMAGKISYIPEDAGALRKAYKNNSLENIEQFEKRILKAYADTLEKYKGKRILIVAHAGSSRPIIHRYMGASHDDAYYSKTIKNADPFRLMTTPITNPLDQWILSRLQILIGQVHDAMEGYDISRGCRAITEYMDELTNWYVRLSRRRFWESGMTPDKESAYETLYTVLLEISKLMAPLMPFLSESIYRGLTNRESVHLEYITRPNQHLIANDLNRDMEICEHIVSLGLALRSRKNIRVRQPLTSVTITRELSEYYQTIIRDELNVKEVRFENPEKLAKKICKPDARKIGPKYGKEVQKVITEAKNGNFIEKENGIIDVGGFILEPGEYTMEYLPLEGIGDVEGGYGMVISLDTVITEDLRLEGYARDIVRAVQDMRKEANYSVTDRVSVSLDGGMTVDILSGWRPYIERETLSTILDELPTIDLEKTISDEEMGDIVLKIRK